MWISRSELRAIQDWQRAIFRTLEAMQKDINRMSAALDRLTEEVSRNTTVTGSAIALIKGLAQQIKDLGNIDPRVTALADQIAQSADAMGAAVTENTPAEPTE